MLINVVTHELKVHTPQKNSHNENILRFKEDNDDRTFFFRSSNIHIMSNGTN